MNAKLKTTCIILIQFLFLSLFSCSDDISTNKPLPQIKGLISLSAEEYASIAYDNPKLMWKRMILR